MIQGELLKVTEMNCYKELLHDLKVKLLELQMCSPSVLSKHGDRKARLLILHFLLNLSKLACNNR
jgi:hypothetical protein